MLFSRLFKKYKTKSVIKSLISPYATGGAWGLVILTLMVVMFAYPSFDQYTFCNIVAPFKQTNNGQSYLLSCSNVRQQIISMQNVIHEHDTDSGYDILKVQDSKNPGIVEVQVKKDRQQVLFYPRLSGKDTTVEILEGSTSRRLFFAEGIAGKWNPIGEQHTVSLYCAQEGFNQDYDVTLRLVLKGQWAQVWTKNGCIFF